MEELIYTQPGTIFVIHTSVQPSRITNINTFFLIVYFHHHLYHLLCIVYCTPPKVVAVCTYQYSLMKISLVEMFDQFLLESAVFILNNIYHYYIYYISMYMHTDMYIQCWLMYIHSYMYMYVGPF